MVKKVTYEPFMALDDPILDKDTALCQAANVLDMLMDVAVQRGDTELMAFVANGWMDLSDKLEYSDEAVAEVELESDGSKPLLGFSVMRGGFNE